MEKMRNDTGGREAEKHGDTILDGSVDQEEEQNKSYQNLNNKGKD